LKYPLKLVLDYHNTNKHCLNLLYKSVVFVIIIVIYCRLVVRIIDTRAQKMVSHEAVHFTEMVFAHGQLERTTVASFT